MADVKPTAVSSSTSLAPMRAPSTMRADPRPPVQNRPVVEDRIETQIDVRQAEPSEALIAEFIAPAPRTTAWLGDARLAATLKAASAELAPGGVAEDAADRYAASVIETHLVARARLTKLTNALLKT